MRPYGVVYLKGGLRQLVMANAIFRKLSTRVLLSYSVPLVCLSLLGVASYTSAQKTFELERERSFINQADYAASGATYHLIDSIRKVKGYALHPDRIRYVAAYSNSYQPFLSDLDVLSELAEDHQEAGHSEAEHSNEAHEDDAHQDDDLEQLVAQLAAEGTRINTLSRQIFARLQADDEVAAAALIDELAVDNVGAIRQRLQAHLAAELDENAEQFEAAQKALRNTVLLGTVLAGVVTLALATFASTTDSSPNEQDGECGRAQRYFGHYI